MARNEEKHCGLLNRLYLKKEQEGYEKANPKRPKLDTLYTPEEIQQWIPSIKKDINFYLKKSEVTCYSDTHVKECQAKVVKLEKEFKSFVCKMKRLSSAPLEAIPWTNRPYKRKKLYDSEENSSKEFKRIATPILDEQKDSNNRTSQLLAVNWSVMDQPLNFSSVSTNGEKVQEEEMPSSLNISGLYTENRNVENWDQHVSLETRTIHRESLDYCRDRYDKEKDNQPKHSIVNYGSSDNESS